MNPLNIKSNYICGGNNAQSKKTEAKSSRKSFAPFVKLNVIMTKFKMGDAVIAKHEAVSYLKKNMHVVEQRKSTTICVYRNAANEPVTIELPTSWLSVKEEEETQDPISSLDA